MIRHFVQKERSALHPRLSISTACFTDYYKFKTLSHLLIISNSRARTCLLFCLIKEKGSRRGSFLMPSATHLKCT